MKHITVAFIIIVGVILLAKAVGAAIDVSAPINPFSDYEDIMPGQTNPGLRYQCDYYRDYYSAYDDFYCNLDDATVVAIYVSVSEGKINYTGFRLRPGTVRLGDLMTWYPDMVIRRQRFTNVVTNSSVSVYVPRKRFGMRASILYVSFRVSS